MKMFSCIFLVLTTFSMTCHAIEENHPPPARITELFPESWVEYPAIEPAIPPDYRMKENDDGMSVVWGKESDLENMDQTDFTTPSEGAFVLRYSNESQTGSNNFSFNKKELIREFNKFGFQVMRSGYGHWGEYPIFAYEGTSSDGKTVRMAWLGLNSPEKSVLAINMIPTDNKMNDERLWNRFIHNTRPLTGYYLQRALGSDMQTGCTIYSCAKGVVEAKVQQREKDKKLAISVTPLNDHTTFTVHKTEQGIMPGPWRHGERITKIHGTLVYKDANNTNLTNTVINVFNEPVTEFTIKPKNRA